MGKTPKPHKAVGEDFLAEAKQSSVVHRFPFPPAMVWKALLDPVAWTEWLPITKVTWTSPEPFGAGTTRTVEVGNEIIEETFFAWEDGRRMAFRFEASTLPVTAAVEDYRVVGVDGGCEMHWTGKAAAPLLLGGIITGQLEKGLREGMPKLEKLIAANPERFR
ncbi:SRPBCC family protein [Hyphomonas sp.]|uniref:SRPBCC family protein n=1 Tax=Hyphomonas sp. TaxID=87 RepID=UPI00391D1585